MRLNKDLSSFKYVGEVEFLSREEWNKELEILFKDLQEENGSLTKKPDPRSIAGKARQKIKVVYGTQGKIGLGLDHMKSLINPVVANLGKTITVKENNPEVSF